MRCVGTAFPLAVSKPNAAICDSCQSAYCCEKHILIRRHSSPPLADWGTGSAAPVPLMS